MWIWHARMIRAKSFGGVDFFSSSLLFFPSRYMISFKRARCFDFEHVDGPCIVAHMKTEEDSCRETFIVYYIDARGGGRTGLCLKQGKIEGGGRT
jgi:hypothetical protein